RFVRIILFFLRIEEVLFLEDWMQLAKRLEDRRLVREVEIAVLGEQALEHELVRGRSAQADIRVAIANDLVVRAIVFGGEPRVAERRQRISSDRNGIALADNDESGQRG